MRNPALRLSTGLIATLLLATTAFGRTSETQAGSGVQPAPVAPKAPDIDKGALVQGERKGAEIGGTETHNYQIDLKAGEFVRVLADQRGVDLTLRILGSPGRPFVTANVEMREYGVEELLAIIPSDGRYSLTVKPSEACLPGSYTVEVRERHLATGNDWMKITGQRAFVEAIRAMELGTVEGRRRCLKRLTDSLEVWQKLKDPIWEARLHTWIGSLHFHFGEYAAAQESYATAREMRAAAGDRLGEAEVVNLMGEAYSEVSDYPKALESFNRALELLGPTVDRRINSAIYAGLAALYRESGESEKTIDAYARASRMYRDAGDIGNQAIMALSLANYYKSVGDYQSSLDSVRTIFADPRLTSVNYINSAANLILGDVLYLLGERRLARGFLEEALKGFADAEPNEKAYTQVGIALALMDDGDLDGALGYLQDALKTVRDRKDLSIEVGALRQIAKVYRLRGDRTQALATLDDALAISVKIGSVYQRAMSLLDIGVLMAEVNDYGTAIRDVEQAIAILHSTGHRLAEADALYQFARINVMRNDLEAAKDRIGRAISIIESSRMTIVADERRSSFLAGYRDYYDLYVEVLMRLHEKSPGFGFDVAAIEASERCKARTLLDSLVAVRSDIRQGVDARLLERERAVQRRLNAKEAYRRDLPEDQAEKRATAEREIDTITFELENVREEIRRTSPRYADLVDPQPAGLAAFRRQLDDSTTALVYHLGATRSFVWTITPTTVTSGVLPERVVVERSAKAAVEWMRTSYRRRGDAGGRASAAELSRIVLSPVEQNLTTTRLVIVPDGALHTVPFAALFVPGSSRYMVEDHEIVVLSSVSLVGQLRQEIAGREPARRAIAIFADPVYQARDERITTLVPLSGTATSPSPAAAPVNRIDERLRARGATEIERLRHSRREADEIARHFPVATRCMFLGFEANRAAVETADLEQYRFIHFAVHGALDLARPQLSGLVLSTFDASGRPRDGFLPAHELYNLKLNADLVVLSACETGLGESARGEGASGMNRGFFYAGARRVVSSLWSVNDESTATLMQRFYENLTDNRMSAAAALREAQAWRAKQNGGQSSPFYWAAFTLEGDWR